MSLIPYVLRLAFKNEKLKPCQNLPHSVIFDAMMLLLASFRRSQGVYVEVVVHKLDVSLQSYIILWSFSHDKLDLCAFHLINQSDPRLACAICYTDVLQHGNFSPLMTWPAEISQHVPC